MVLGIIFAFFLTFIFLGYLSFVFWKIRKANQALLKDAGSSNLEEILHAQNSKIQKQNLEIKQLESEMIKLQAQLDLAIQKVKVIRFNAFPGEGGDQSFSVALLDRHNNGAVISNLRNRSNDRIYAKPIEQGQSTYHLTQEELKAIG